MALNIIGTKSSSSFVDYYDLDTPLDRIDFLYTENRVCNVKFVDEDDEIYNYFEDDEDVWKEGDDIKDEYSPYAVFNDYCIEGISGIEYMSIYMDDMLDLVGLRGRASNDGPGISSLGFIWYNDSDDVCLDVDYG